MENQGNGIENLLLRAAQAGYEAAIIKKRELDAAGAKYAIVNEATGQRYTMNDLCGFAYAYIPTQPGLSVRLNAVKAAIKNGIVGHNSYQRALSIRIPHVDQAISVNEAGAEAAAKVIREAGFIAYVESRLD